MVTANEKRKRLRELLSRPTATVAPGVYDCISARLVERAGFEVGIITGAGMAASVLGVPDVGLVTMSESLVQTKNIVSSVDLPIVGDCDTGYGNPINVRRTVQEFEAIGVAALFIEDQVTPKRCGHFQGKEIISTDAMEQKIRAAVDVRIDRDLILIARTDARAVAGVEEAVLRSQRYVKAGCEMLFVEAPESVEELQYFGTELAPLGVPLMVNLVEGGRTPLVSVADLSSFGFSFVSYSGSLQKSAIKTMQDLLSSLREHGDVAEFYPERMISISERSEILGLPEFFELERLYASD